MTVPNINQYLAESHEAAELDDGATIKRYLIVRREDTREVERDVVPGLDHLALKRF